MTIELLMFDMDGTLIDSMADIAAQVNRSLVAAGLEPHPQDRIRGLIGQGPRYVFDQLLEGKAPAARLDGLVVSFETLYAKHLVDTTAVYPGMMGVLEHYKGIKKVIVTNKPQPFADALVAKLGLAAHFAAVYGAEAFKARKPDPMPLLESCKRFSVKPSRAAYVGDSTADMQASKAAATVSVAALYGYGKPAAVRKLKPDFEVTAPAQLVGLFN
ncbi:MAG: HAD-IA family hydrolase [Elusimicrobia bacterium]|nr:HAD-IA family hydrolase [Elusimicrobiota bacterium]